MKIVLLFVGLLVGGFIGGYSAETIKEMRTQQDVYLWLGCTAISVVNTDCRVLWLKRDGEFTFTVQTSSSSLGGPVNPAGSSINQ